MGSEKSSMYADLKDHYLIKVKRLFPKRSRLKNMKDQLYAQYFVDFHERQQMIRKKVSQIIDVLNISRSAKVD